MCLYAVLRVKGNRESLELRLANLVDPPRAGGRYLGRDDGSGMYAYVL